MTCAESKNAFPHFATSSLLTNVAQYIAQKSLFYSSQTRGHIAGSHSWKHQIKLIMQHSSYAGRMGNIPSPVATQIKYLLKFVIFIVVAVC